MLTNQHLGVPIIHVADVALGGKSRITILLDRVEVIFFLLRTNELRIRFLLGCVNSNDVAFYVVKLVYLPDFLDL